MSLLISWMVYKVLCSPIQLGPRNINVSTDLHAIGIIK